LKSKENPKVEALHKSALIGSALNYLAFILSKGTTFVATIILTRLLTPDDFGLLALGLFITYFDGLSDFGVGAAYIFQPTRDQVTEDRTSSIAFIFNQLWGGILATLAYFCASEITSFFHEPRILPIIQVLAIGFIISSLGNIHEARLRKALLFRRRFIVEIAKSLSKAGLSIGLALNDFGVWSLVWGQLGAGLVATVCYWLLSGWLPKWEFDLKIYRSLVGYGAQIALMLLLGTFIQNLDYLLIGRRMDAVQLGIYTMAFRLPELLILNISSVISPALFPAYARLQHNAEALQTAFLSTTRYISLITFPLGVGTAIISPHFVSLFFTERWAAAIPVMQILSLYATVATIGFNVGDIYKAVGRPDILTKLAIIHLAIAGPALWYASGVDIVSVAWAQLGSTILIVMVRIAIASYFLKLKLRKILSALLPGFTGVTIMAVSLFAINTRLSAVSMPIQMATLVISGALIYIFSLTLFHYQVVRNLFVVLRPSRTGVNP
jgi:PST family polysaccharide transporter